MIIEIFDNGILKEDCENVELTVACRGIIKKDDLFLAVHLDKWDITTFPGGRLEEGESLEECCVREVLEETGISSKVIAHTVEVKEYFIDAKWSTHYFICDFISDTKKVDLTEEETDLGMKAVWLTLEELLDTFENNMTLHEHGPNIHNREFLGFINSL